MNSDSIPEYLPTPHIYDSLGESATWRFCSHHEHNHQKHLTFPVSHLGILLSLNGVALLSSSTLAGQGTSSNLYSLGG